ncbi:YutD family protein [Macrococcus caseolyticus]|nr:YutD family protein [Macrococcus caseolyticus]
MIQLNEHYFELIENYNDAFNQEMFEGRYSEILDRYPYVVGDIGFEQLRLKGFFDDKKKGADISRRFSSIQDYLLEYCNFGCPYFILKRLSESEIIKWTEPETIETISYSAHEDNSAEEMTDAPEALFTQEETNHKIAMMDEASVEDEPLETVNQAPVTHNKTLKDFLR